MEEIYIYCSDVVIIPWDIILSNVPLNSLTDPEICGIDHGSFVKMVINFIYKKTEQPEFETAWKTVGLLSNQIYSCISPPIKVGSLVQIDPENIVLDTDKKIGADFGTIEKWARDGSFFHVKRIEDGYVYLQGMLDKTEDAYLKISSCIVVDRYLEQMDRLILESSIRNQE